MGKVKFASDHRLSKKEFLELIKEIKTASHPGSCNLSTIFQNIKIIEGGESVGTVLFARFKPSKVFDHYIKTNRSGVEVFVKVGSDHKGSLIQEAYAYAFVAKLLRDRRSPNFMQVIMHFTCLNFINTPLNDFVKGDRMGNDAEVIVLERGKGKPLRDVLEKLKPSELLKIIFQLGYSTREMNLHGLRHNDLHTGNVWIEAGPMKKVAYYATKTKRFVMEPRAKIFDFDHSAFTFKDKSVPVNYVIEHYLCPDYGECSNVNDNQDFFRIVSNLLMESRGENLALMRKVVNSMLLNKKYKIPKSTKRITNLNSPFLYYDVICQKHKVKGHVECQPDSVIPEGFMRSFTQLVTETDIFDSLLSKEPVDETYRSISN